MVSNWYPMLLGTTLNVASACNSVTPCCRTLAIKFMHPKMMLLLPSTSLTHPLKKGDSQQENRFSWPLSNRVAKSNSELGNLGNDLLRACRIRDSAVDHGYNPAATTCLIKY